MQPYAVVSIQPVLNPGVEPACPDFVLHSESVRCGKGYAISIGDASQVLLETLAVERVSRLTHTYTRQEGIMKIFYSIPDCSGSKRPPAGGRVDYRSLKALKPAGEAGAA